MILALSPMLVYGPIYELSMRQFFPMMQGPLIVLLTIFVSSIMVTLPSILEFITSPRISRFIVSSSIMLLT